jgi:hypothetical protein
MKNDLCYRINEKHLTQKHLTLPSPKIGEGSKNAPLYSETSWRGVGVR